MSSSILPQIASLNLATSIWSMLEKIYSSNSHSRVLCLRHQLNSTKKGAKSIDEYLGCISKLVEALNLGNQVPNKEVVMIVLKGLGLEYESLVTSHSKIYKECYLIKSVRQMRQVKKITSIN